MAKIKSPKPAPAIAVAIPFDRLKGRLIRSDLSYDRRAIFARARLDFRRFGIPYAVALKGAWAVARRQRAAASAFTQEAEAA